jgi:hypothetical protein
MDVFKYSGRSSRAEFWLFLALTLILVLPIVMILQIGLGVPEWGVLVLSLWPSLAQLSLYVRRIRDIGISAWWGLLLIPIGLPMLFVGFIPSSKKVTHQSHTIRHSNEDKILDLEQIANEEFLYEKAFSELHSDKRRNGLWAKAVSSSSGDEKLAESLYIKYRVQLLINEQQLDQTEKKNDSPQAIKIKENESLSDVNVQQAEGEGFRANMADSMPIRSKGAGFSFEIDDVFAISGDAVVIAGLVKGGKVKVGDMITIQTTLGVEINTQLVKIQIYQKTIEVACSGEHVGLMVRGVASHEIQRKSTIYILKN